MATTILNEELEHEQDIEEFLSDLERMKEDYRKFRL
jgi:bacterioferritin